jgi:hypothetical protein
MFNFMKSIQQGLQFSWFPERVTTYGKISLGTKLGLRLRSNSVNATPSYNLLQM